MRAGAPWCTQCFTDLRPEPQERPVEQSIQQPLLPAALPAQPQEPAPVVHSDAPDPRWPCTACGAANPLSVAACAACGAGFLSSLRETEPPLLVVPGVGDLAALSRAQRLGLAAGVVLTVLLLVLVLGLLTR